MSHIADFNIMTSKNRHRSTNACSVVINNANHAVTPPPPPPKPKPKPTPPKPTTSGGGNVVAKPKLTPNGANTPKDVPHVSAPITYPEVTPIIYPPGQERFQPVMYPPAPQIQERSVTLEGSEDVVETTETTTAYAQSCREELYKLIASTFGDILKTNNSKLIANIIDTSGKVIVDAVNLVNIIALACQVSAEDVTIEYEAKEGGCCASITRIKKIENIKIGSYDFKLAYNEIYNNLTDIYNISLKRTIIPLEDLL